MTSLTKSPPSPTPTLINLSTDDCLTQHQLPSITSHHCAPCSSFSRPFGTLPPICPPHPPGMLPLSGGVGTHAGAASSPVWGCRRPQVIPFLIIIGIQFFTFSYLQLLIFEHSNTSQISQFPIYFVKYAGPSEKAQYLLDHTV